MGGKHHKKNNPNKRTETWKKASYVALTATLATTLSTLVIKDRANHENSTEVSAIAPRNTNNLFAASAPEQAEFMVLTGVDDRRNMGGKYGDPKEIAGTRTDAIMLVAIPKDNRHVIAMSIPRDTVVDRPACNEYDPGTEKYNTTTVPAEKGVKINSIIGVGGPACLTKTIKEYTGVEATRYAQVNFQAFKDTVDALKGINMCFDEPVVDEVLGTIIPKTGCHTIDGETALSLARARSVEGTPKSDFQRNHQQQQVAAAIYSKIRENHNLAATLSSLNSIRKNVTGEGISPTDILQLAGKATTIDPKNIRLITAPIDNEPNPQNPDVTLKWDTIKRTINDALSSTANTHQITNTQTTTQPIPPRNTTRILIKTQPSNPQAETLKNDLQQLGWNVERTDDYTGQETTINFGPRSAAAAIQASSDMNNTPLQSGDTNPKLRDLTDAGPVILIGTTYQHQPLNPRTLEGIQVPTPNSGTTAHDYIPTDLTDTPTGEVNPT
jgi:putative transcriptional regulator